MQIQHLCYQHEKNAPYFFKDLTLELEKGKIHALHGKNGIGKTVFLNLLNQKVPEQAIVSGKIIGAEKVTLVNQRFDQMIADQFTFMENLQFACIGRFPSFFSRLKTSFFVPDFLDKFHINLSTPASKLSGGQRQILALLMVLQQPIDTLLLDEPTATLDEQNAIMVFDFLKTLSQQNKTILVVCHDRELVAQYTTGNEFFLEVDPSGTRIMRERGYSG